MCPIQGEIRQLYFVAIKKINSAWYFLSFSKYIVHLTKPSDINLTVTKSDATYIVSSFYVYFSYLHNVKISTK